MINRLNKTAILMLWLISVTSVFATNVPDDQGIPGAVTHATGAQKKSLVVFLHGLGGRSGQMGNTDAGKDLVSDVVLLEPDAADYGHGPGLWFPMDVTLAFTPEVIKQVMEAEKEKPGIAGFAIKLSQELAKKKDNLVAGLGELTQSHAFIEEATAKGYLDSLLLIISQPLSKVMAPSVAKLDLYIEENLRSRNLTHDDLIIAGWSMGGIMALRYAFDRTLPCRAVIAANGVFVPPQKIQSVPRDLFFVSGKQDKVIPFWLQKRSTDLLQQTVMAHAEVHYIEEEGHCGFVDGTEQIRLIKAQLVKYLSK